MRATASLVALVAAALVALGGGAAGASASAPASASGTDAATPVNGCVTAEEARVFAAGDSGSSAPPTFNRWFFKRSFTIDASLDGMDGTQLPVSVEQVCGVKKKYKSQAVPLAGNDGIALIYSSTVVVQNGQVLKGQAALDAVAGADTATLTVRFASQKKWGADEDGNQVPTFKASRVVVTD
jgi:hypothetical protein